MANRLPSTPPVLPGYTHVHILGSGGFADVFLYEQNLPRRPVAVKVMLADLVDDHVRSMFRSEVNLMGKLSAHPNILTVYGASVSGDGRPYIVMELCSTTIGDRFRTEPYDVDEALEIAVRIGSALETAHRAGTLHRDVKPANIMTTGYGHPVLSDFGIAGSAQSEDTDVLGVSVPWSAPEVLRDETSGTVASEVYSFGATIYSLLAGRSPAEIRGRRNGTKELTERIVAHELQPLGVPVPKSLERMLQRSMAKAPADRYRAVLPMLEQLQEVQREIGVTVTPIDVTEDAWTKQATEAVAASAGDEQDDPLRLRERAARRARHHDRIGDRIDISSTSTHAADPPRRRSMQGVVIGLATAVVLGIVAAAAVALSSTRAQIPVVDSVSAESVPGGVSFTWEDPGLVGADSYLVRGPEGAVIQRGTSFTLQGVAGDELCITVAVNRDGRSGDTVEACGEAS